jgi:hypothetical protein
MQPADITAELRHNIRLTLHDWIYSFSSKQQVILKCRQNATWITSTWSLQECGILHNASACHVTG